MAQLKKKLTVAIPTYNRPVQLAQTLSKLLPQLTDECRLLILDNHSDVLASDAIAHELQGYPGVDCTIVRNKRNVGGDSNIIRCFELCDTQWLWTLGDDDDVQDNAISIIMTDIGFYPDAVHINYYSASNMHPPRHSAKIAKGRIGFLENIDFFGASIFVSVNLYNNDLLRRQWLANHNTYSCCSQWLVIFNSLNSDSITVYSDKIVCNNPNSFEEGGYSSINLFAARGFSTLFDLMVSKAERKLIISKVITVTNGWITLESVVKCLLVEYYNANKELDILFLFRRFYSSFFIYTGIKNSLKYRIYYTSLWLTPDFSFSMIRKIILKSRGVDINKYIIKVK